MANDKSLSLLMVYELNDEFGRHHVVCFQDPVLAGSVGVDVRAILGRFQPREDGSFDPATFQFNTAFVSIVTEFMNASVASDPDLAEDAKMGQGDRLEVIDPRCIGLDSAEVPMTEILGWFAVTELGEILADSFLYNHNHVWFDERFGVSGLLSLREFYNFVHVKNINNPSPVEIGQIDEKKTVGFVEYWRSNLVKRFKEKFNRMQ